MAAIIVLSAWREQRSSSVELEGTRVEARLPGRQGKLLFAYLVLTRDRAVSRSELVGSVWPGELPRDPSDAFAALLSKLRTALGQP